MHWRKTIGSANFLEYKCRLANPPRWPYAACMAVPPLLAFRHIPDDPSQERRVRKVQATVGHHRRQISIAQPEVDVPADAQLDNLGVKYPSAVNRIAGNRFGHWEPLLWSPRS